MQDEEYSWRLLSESYTHSSIRMGLNSRPPAQTVNENTDCIIGRCVFVATRAAVRLLYPTSIAAPSFTIQQAAASGISAVGSLGHVAALGPWKFTLDLLNLGSVPAEARIKFLSSAGQPLELPLTLPESTSTDAPRLASTLDRPLGANALLEIDSAGADEAATLTGWSQLLANGPVTGFGIFRNELYHWSAAVPLETVCSWRRHVVRDVLHTWQNTGKRASQ